VKRKGGARPPDPRPSAHPQRATRRADCRSILGRAPHRGDKIAAALFAPSMPLQTQIHRSNEFATLKVTGPATLTDFVAFIAELGEITRAHGDKRLLVDLLDVENEFRFTDHFLIGEEAARQLKHLERVASVVPEAEITHTSEKVAVKQGLQLQVFTSMKQAIAWLTL
jgi:hypothetical protein